MVGVFAHSDGAFKPATSIPVNNSGTWQNAQEVWAKNSGVWIKVFPAEVREPPAGELYSLGSPRYYWSSNNFGGGVIEWNNVAVFSGVGTLPDNITTLVVGSWTYYRGTYKGQSLGPQNKEYALYRIGTP